MASSSGRSRSVPAGSYYRHSRDLQKVELPGVQQIGSGLVPKSFFKLLYSKHVILITCHMDRSFILF